MNGLELVKKADTVSIVRWVAGENAIWLRIQSDSGSWLINDDETVASPSETNRVEWIVGLNARQHVDFIGDRQANLPFPSRTPDPNPGDLGLAVSATLCVDLTDGTLQTTGVASLLDFDPVFYDRTAEITEGVYQPGNLVPIPARGSFSIGRGKRRSCHADFIGTRLPISICDDGDTVGEFRQQIRIDISCMGQSDFLGINNLYDGGQITLTLEENTQFGFTEDAAVLLDEENNPGSEFQVNPDSAFTQGGQALYREVTVTWNGGTRNLNEPLTLILDLRISYNCQTDHSESQVDYVFNIPNRGDVQDDPPFDGESQ